MLLSSTSVRQFSPPRQGSDDSRRPFGHAGTVSSFTCVPAPYPRRPGRQTRKRHSLISDALSITESDRGRSPTEFTIVIDRRPGRTRTA